MYAGPDIIRPAGAIQARRYAISTFAAVFALGLCLFLIAATIVLALIPIYIPSKSATLSSKATTSKAFSMFATLDSSVTGRRRRQITSGLSTVVGGSFGSAGLALVKTTLLSALSGIVNDVTVNSATIAYKGTSTNSYYLVITAFVTYFTSCPLGCQNGLSSTIRQRLYNTVSSIVYSSVLIITNGANLFANIKATQIDYVSEIIPGTSSSVTSTLPATAVSTSTATTPFVG